MQRVQGVQGCRDAGPTLAYHPQRRPCGIIRHDLEDKGLFLVRHHQRLCRIVVPPLLGKGSHGLHGLQNAMTSAEEPPVSRTQVAERGRLPHREVADGLLCRPLLRGVSRGGGGRGKQPSTVSSSRFSAGRRGVSCDFDRLLSSYSLARAQAAQAAQCPKYRAALAMLSVREEMRWRA